MTVLKGTAKAGAIFSPCERYRYRLWRTWGDVPAEHKRIALWIMLNPSTATHEVLDPTVTRCQNYSKAWGFDGFEVCNLFAIRSTDPKVMLADPDPIGSANDVHIIHAARAVSLVMVAWGNHGRHRDRGKDVVNMLDVEEIPLNCLAITGAGQPGHPLYLRSDLAPVPFNLGVN
jgi:hypothetical protein